MADDKPTRRDMLTAGMVGVGGFVAGLAFPREVFRGQKTPDGYVDFAKFKDCEAYEQLQKLSREYQQLVFDGKQKDSLDDFTTFLYDKLRATSSGGEPFLTLNSPGFVREGFSVGPVNIEITEKKGLRYFVEAVQKNDLNLLNKPSGSTLPKPRDRNSCGQSVD